VRVVRLGQQIEVEDRVFFREAIAPFPARLDGTDFELPRHKPRHLGAGNAAHSLEIGFHQPLLFFAQAEVIKAR
jgi:hypothetical protein